MNMKRRSYHLTLLSAATMAQAGISFAQALDHGKSYGAAEHSQSSRTPRTVSVTRHLQQGTGGSNAQVG
jgi:hypothetical protein